MEIVWISFCHLSFSLSASYRLAEWLLCSLLWCVQSSIEKLLKKRFSNCLVSFGSCSSIPNVTVRMHCVVWFEILVDYLVNLVTFFFCVNRFKCTNVYMYAAEFGSVISIPCRSTRIKRNIEEKLTLLVFICQLVLCVYSAEIFFPPFLLCNTRSDHFFCSLTPLL